MTGPNDKIHWGATSSGKPAYMGRRTAAHVDWTITQLAIDHPKAKFHLIQSAYNVGVVASAGTHDKDACLDVWLEGLGWGDAQTWLRKHGWAAWHRFPPAFVDHIHMISLGYGTAPVGTFIPGQVADYYNHAEGLKGEHSKNDDPSWHPANIASTIFNYPAYLEDNMPYTDWPEKDKKALIADLSDAFRQEIFAGAGDGTHNFGYLFSEMYNKEFPKAKGK